MTSSYDYVSDAQAIMSLSEKRLQDMLPPLECRDDIKGLFSHLIYACADPSILRDLRCHDDFLKKGRDALGRDAPVFADSMMVAAGIQTTTNVRCFLPQVSVETARAQGRTRSSLAVDYWQDELEGCVIAIGNAPTALYRLMELLDETTARPACVALFPLGFVGAREAKESFLNYHSSIPFVTLLGQRGGSALAAAAINKARP